MLFFLQLFLADNSGCMQGNFARNQEDSSETGDDTADPRHNPKKETFYDQKR